MAFIAGALTAVHHGTAGGVGFDVIPLIGFGRQGQILVQLSDLDAMELHGLDELLAVLVHQIVGAHHLVIGGNEGAPVIGLVVHGVAVGDAAGIALFVVDALADYLAFIVGSIGKNGQFFVAAQLQYGHLGVEGHDIHFGIDSLGLSGLAAGFGSGDLLLDLSLVLGHYLQGAQDAFVRGVHTHGELVVGIDLQQQGQTVAQAGVVGGVAGVILKGAPAFFHDAAVVIAPVAVRHGHLALGFQVRTFAQGAFAEHVTVVGQQLRIGTGVQAPVVGDGVTHIGTVGGVAVDEQDRIPVVHQLNDGAGADGLQLGHVAVDVEALTFAAGADQLGSELSGNTVLAQVIVAVRAGVGADDDDQILQQIVVLALSHFPGKYHHGFLAFHFAGMDVAVDVNHCLIRIDLGGIGRSGITHDHIRDLGT